MRGEKIKFDTNSEYCLGRCAFTSGTCKQKWLSCFLWSLIKKINKGDIHG